MNKTLPVFMIALALTACNKAPAEKAAPAAPAAVVNGAPQQTDAPAFAPPYPGATPGAWTTFGATSGLFNFETSDTPEQVGAFYARIGGEKGLSPRPTGEGADPGIVYSASGAAGEITVIARAEGGKTSGQVTWTKP